MNAHARKAFTLIELLIVIAIIAILALIALPNFLEAQTRAKVARVRSDLRTLATSIEAYYTDYNNYSILGNTTLWQNLSDFLWFQLPDGTVTVKCRPLTTPVAYYSGIPPQDPFMEHSFGLGDAKTSRGKGSYLYINFQGAYVEATQNAATWTGNGGTDASVLGGPALPIRFNSSDGKVFRAFWALVSPGPDRSYQDPYFGANGVRLNRAVGGPSFTNGLKNGQHSLYDPTNGTTSVGNIWLVSGGGPD